MDDIAGELFGPLLVLVMVVGGIALIVAGGLSAIGAIGAFLLVLGIGAVWVGGQGATDDAKRIEDNRAAAAVETELAALVGLTGRAASDLRPGGAVELDGGRRVEAVSVHGYVDAGTAIEVVRVDRRRVVVKPVGEKELS